MSDRRCLAVMCVFLGLTPLVSAQNKPITIGFDGDRLARILAMPVPLKFEHAPLKQAIAALAQELSIDLRLDEQALSDAAIRPDTEVALPAQGLALQDALEAMLEPHDLTWRPRFKAIYVTTPEVAEVNAVTRVYPAMDLVATKRGARLEVDSEGLIDVIISVISPDTWELNGGNGSLEWHERTGSLVCTQTWQVQQWVEALLDSLRQSRDLQDIDWSRVRPAPARQDATPHPHGISGGLYHVDDAAWRRPRIHN